jgi:hypothetical protein
MAADIDPPAASVRGDCLERQIAFQKAFIGRPP